MALRDNRLYFLLTWLPLLRVIGGGMLERASDIRQQSATKEDPGRYCAQQILKQVEPLCRTLASDTSELQIEVSETPQARVKLANGKSAEVWEVTWRTCEHRVGHLLLDANTGQVVQVSRDDFVEARKSALSGTQAAVVARRLLEALSGPLASPWRAQSLQEHVSRRWYCRFVGGRMRAYVILSTDGQLVFASVR